VQQDVKDDDFRVRKLRAQENKHLSQDYKSNEKENRRFPYQNFIFIFQQHYMKCRGVHGIFQNGTSPKFYTTKSHAWKKNPIQYMRREKMKTTQ